MMEAMPPEAMAGMGPMHMEMCLRSDGGYGAQHDGSYAACCDGWYGRS